MPHFFLLLASLLFRIRQQNLWYLSWRLTSSPYGRFPMDLICSQKDKWTAQMGYLIFVMTSCVVHTYKRSQRTEFF